MPVRTVTTTTMIITINIIVRFYYSGLFYRQQHNNTRLMTIFQDNPCSTRMSPVEPRMIEVVVTTGALRHAKLQSNRLHQPSIQLVTGRMPFLSPNQQCLSTEGRRYHIPWTCLPGSLPNLSLTTKGSWLPWGRIAKPLISPLTPVPMHFGLFCRLNINYNNVIYFMLQN